jgi:DNA transposition AAA+ family ATPase
MAALANVMGFYAQVKKLQNRAPHLPNIGVMHGDSGLGKSYASIYAQIKTNTIRVEIGESWNRKTFVRAILREGGMAEPRGSTADLMEAAIEMLAEDRNRPLFVDEADKLVDKNLIDLAREIAEHAQIPVILIGEEMLPQKLMRFERVHNRVLDWFSASPCDLGDCKKLAAIFLAGVSIEDELLDDIRVKGQGRARRVVVSLNNAKEWARNTGVSALTRAVYTGAIYTGEAPRARSGRVFAKSGRGA